MALELGAVETIDPDFDRLAVAHMRELRLLEIRHHIDRIERDDRHQLRAGLHEFTDTERPGADGTVDRGGDLCIGQIERRLPLHGPCAIDLRCRFGSFGGENVHFLLRGEQAGFAVLQLRDLFAQRRVSLLSALDGAGAGLHEPVVAGLLLLGEFKVGLGGGDIGAFLLDDGLLQCDLRIEIAYRGFRSIDIRTSLSQRSLEIAIIDPGQQLSGLHRLVVADQDFRDISGDLGRNDRGVGLDIGVVGRTPGIARR